MKSNNDKIKAVKEYIEYVIGKRPHSDNSTLANIIMILDDDGDNPFIVENCPAFVDFDQDSLYDNLCIKHGEASSLCMENDCPIKKVIRECKKYNGNELAEKILSAFKIQEVNV